MRGRDEVRANLGRLFVEHERYRFVLGDVDVAWKVVHSHRSAARVAVAVSE